MLSDSCRILAWKLGSLTSAGLRICLWVLRYKGGSNLPFFFFLKERLKTKRKVSHILLKLMVFGSSEFFLTQLWKFFVISPYIRIPVHSACTLVLIHFRRLPPGTRLPRIIFQDWLLLHVLGIVGEEEHQPLVSRFLAIYGDWGLLRKIPSMVRAMPQMPIDSGLKFHLVLLSYPAYIQPEFLI